MQAQSEKEKSPKGKVAISKPSAGAAGLTGRWRLKKPVMDRSKCTKCLICWLYCPESAIAREKDNTVTINYEYCKGCGICGEVCPSKSITIVKEG